MGKCLHISPTTMGTQRSRIYGKLRLKGMPQLIRFAVGSGITRVDAT